MILVIDNYDSFVFNLAHALHRAGADVDVVRNDALSVNDAFERRADAIVLSPGPGRPEQAGICLDLIAQAPVDLPIFGVCLGHQAIGMAFGATVDAAPAIVHGKVTAITHDGSGVFAKAPPSLGVTRYHSLALRPETVPDSLDVTARTADGVVMGVRHTARPVHGVQFHPESVACEGGQGIVDSFVDLVRDRVAA